MATNENIIRVTINVNPKENSRYGKSTGYVAVRSEIEQTMYDMKNLIVENLAIRVAASQERALTTNIARVLTTIVEKELTRMGRQITSLAVGLGDKKSLTPFRNENPGGRSSTSYLYAPQGTLSVTGPIARSMQGQVGPVSLVSGTGPWPARREKYLKWKKKKFGTDKWFKNTGNLAQALRNPSLYLGSYGGVKVTYDRSPQGSYLRSATEVSALKAGPGRKSNRIVIGKLSVGVLSRITTSMVTDPGQRQPSPWASGLFEYLPDEVEKKLLNTREAYRPFLEHFLSYYLTRSIPNAVFYEIEKRAKVASANEITLGRR